MRIPGTRSSTGSTILQQSSQEDERRAARKRSRQQSQQQVQTGILATGNLLGDVARTIPQFQANSIRVDEGAKNRAFEENMLLARQGFERGESVLDRASQEKIAASDSSPVDKLVAALLVERRDAEAERLRGNPLFPAGELDAAEKAILTGSTTPALQKFREQERVAAPVQRAAQYAGVKNPDLVGRGEAGAYQGLSRDKAMRLLGQAAIDQGENSEAVRQIAEKFGYALPERTFMENVGRVIFNPIGNTLGLTRSDADATEEELVQLLEALKTQYGPVATDRGFTSTRPLSPMARREILRTRKQLEP